jgi:hypothetical protein
MVCLAVYCKTGMTYRYKWTQAKHYNPGKNRHHNLRGKSVVNRTDCKATGHQSILAHENPQWKQLHSPNLQ